MRQRFKKGLQVALEFAVLGLMVGLALVVVLGVVFRRFGAALVWYDEVASILIDLTQRETMNYSAQFATALVPELRQLIHMRRKPHRFAGFVVLKAPDVPSVLVELGYLSNRRDERMLTNPKSRAAIAAAIARAVVTYFKAQKS